MQANQIVNKVGKYLYKNIDSAYEYNTSSNTCDVYMIIYYQIPKLQQIPGRGRAYNDVHEMKINLSITTYQNKIRVNIIELDPNQRTLGYDLYETYQLNPLSEFKKIVLQRVQKRISKAYSDYEFIF